MPSNLISTLSKLQIQHITTNSSQVGTGSAFFAIRGTHLDGNDYIEQAITSNVKLIVTDKSCDIQTTCQILVVPDARIALAEAAHYLYPDHPEYMVAVTGTNGKTSIVNYFWQICSLLGAPAISIGTIGISCNDQALKQDLSKCGEILTTPDIVTMRKMLGVAKRHKIKYLAFEASSHGLDQKRIYGVPVIAAALTNITHDHLDYHKTFDSYCMAKLRLFTENLRKDGVAIISTDLRNIDEVKSHLKSHNIRYITVGQNGDLDITSSISTIAEQDIKFTYNGQNYSFTTNILGSFQASNILIASLMAASCGLRFEDIVQVLPMLQYVRGRLERVTSSDHKFHIFVDYAHTPDALEKTLLELSILKRNKLHVVFGCGGDRDKTKRPVMGNIASKLADTVIITDDNPRTEDARSIRDQIAQDLKHTIQIAGREEAIKYAISQLQDNDILLIAGKGHEDCQIIGDKILPFDDVSVARKYIS
jgi:UDP-N-acetylmuramoyl-L-alanyl-D-glutamate--2,6-diaminopimelate ligase